MPPDGSNWKAFESDDGDSDEGDKADEFEAAYNLRFEDPEKSNEVLKTYARDIAASRSVRRETATGRKAKRQLEKELKEEQTRQRQEEKARLKKLKLEEAGHRLQKIRRTAGMRTEAFHDDQLLKVLDEAWEDDKWEEQMKKRFGDEYYAEEDRDMSSQGGDDEDGGGAKGKQNKLKKPTWDDDIDIGNIVDGYEEDAPQFTLSDVEDNNDNQAEGEGEGEEEEERSRPSKKRKTSKDHKKERTAARKAAKQTHSALEALVDTKMRLDDPDVLAAAAATSTKKKHKAHTPFRWRESSPTAFGLTARDILLAPSDQALNQFAGIKKYAGFKDPETKERERRRLGKRSRLRKWRREVFGKEFQNDGPDFGFERLVGAEDGHEFYIGKDEDEKKQKKEKKKKTLDDEVQDVEAEAEKEKEKKRKRKRKRGHAKSAK